MSRQPWNTNKEHGRKFLCSAGGYVDANGSLAEAPLAFWAEWEAPSYVRKCWAKDGELPQFLQEPVWERPTIRGVRQNTDPWVFGDCFRYSNCHQLNQKGLRNLAAGSVILFGSKRPGKFEFVVDTVFVVGEHRQKFSPANPPNTDEAFRVCTIESLASGGDANTCGTSSACGAQMPCSRCTAAQPTRLRSTGCTPLSRAGAQTATIFALLGQRCPCQLIPLTRAIGGRPR
jgi:hypothetical protein